MNYEIERGSELLQYGVWNQPFARDRYGRWKLNLFASLEGFLKALLGWSVNDIFNRRAGPDPYLRLWPKPSSLEAHLAFIEGAKRQFVSKAAIEIGLGIGFLNVLPPLGATYIVHGALVFLREQDSLRRAKEFVEQRFSRF